MDVLRGEVREFDLEPPGTTAANDLGMRWAEEVAAFLLGLAQTSPRRDVAEDAIMPAMIVRDVVSWTELVDMARDRRLDDDVREPSDVLVGAGGGCYERW